MKIVSLALITGIAVCAQAAQPAPSGSSGSPSTAVKDAPAAGGDKPSVDAESSTEGPAASAQKRKAAVSSIQPEALEDFENQPPVIQQLICNALDLTRMNLTYTFGSADPKQGGMDCSGAIYHLLTSMGVAGVPRQSDQMCGWVKQRAALHRTVRAEALTHEEFGDLKPGDLLFWSNTYRTGPREIPVSHVMLYLGKLKANGKHVVFGASDGRSYAGQRRTGVSVFDFSLPKPGSPASFYGYGLIPGVGESAPNPSEHIIASAPPASSSKPAEEVRRAEIAGLPSPELVESHLPK